MTDREPQALAAPTSAWPVFARKLIAIWRGQHLCKGHDLTIFVWPGRWPEDQPREVLGVPVAESDSLGGPTGILAIGRDPTGVARGTMVIAAALYVGCTADELAISAAHMTFGEHEMHVWLAPDEHGQPSAVFQIARKETT